MGNDFSPPLDASVTFSGLTATSEFWKRRQKQRAEEKKSNMFFLSDLLGWFDDFDESESLAFSLVNFAGCSRSIG
jgi:hypothetical protein